MGFFKYNVSSVFMSKTFLAFIACFQWHKRKTYKLNFTPFYKFIFIQRTWRVDYLTTKGWSDSAVHRQTKQFDCSLCLIEIIAKLSKCSSVIGYTLRLSTTMAEHLPQIIPQCIAHCVCLHKWRHRGRGLLITVFHSYCSIIGHSIIYRTI